MSIHQLSQEQILPVSQEKLWAFISDPKNLDKITPDFMEFNIISEVPPTMYEGLLIRYKIKLPLMGYQEWLTEIKHIQQGRAFVDEQRTGPYAFWFHRHHLEDMGSGTTKMSDVVTYQLPLGVLGDIVHTVYVKKMLNQIFAYRMKIMNELFKTN